MQIFVIGTKTMVIMYEHYIFVSVCVSRAGSPLLISLSSLSFFCHSYFFCLCLCDCLCLLFYFFIVIVGPIGYRPIFCFFLLLLLLLLLLLQSLSSSSSFPHFYLPQTPQPIHFLKAYDNSYSKTNREHKYKDKDEYKDNDKDKDTERTTESLSVCYIFGIGTTRAFQV